MVIVSKIYHFANEKIKLTIEYDGSSYSGWQKQKSGKTIQEEIEKCLKELLKKK